MIEKYLLKEFEMLVEIVVSQKMKKIERTIAAYDSLVSKFSARTLDFTEMEDAFELLKSIRKIVNAVIAKIVDSNIESEAAVIAHMTNFLTSIDEQEEALTALFFEAF